MQCEEYARVDDTDDTSLTCYYAAISANTVAYSPTSQAMLDLSDEDGDEDNDVENTGGVACFLSGRAHTESVNGKGDNCNGVYGRKERGPPSRAVTDLP